MKKWKFWYQKRQDFGNGRWRYRTTGYDGKNFVFYYYFISFWHLSLGFHVFPPAPNIEIHVPFGFIKIGWRP